MTREERWIPCSKRLPKKSGKYWCTFGKTNLMGSDYYTTESDAKEIFDDPEEYVGWQSHNVVAWMPLPKPYNSETGGGKCHNVNPDYADCDQFVCSNCGIELQDWHRVERDEDDGDITYHEYEFKYCPNCGAKIDVEKAFYKDKHPKNIGGKAAGERYE